MNEDNLFKRNERKNAKTWLEILKGEPIKPKGKKTKNMIVREIMTGKLYDVKYNENIKSYCIYDCDRMIQKYYYSYFEETFVSPYTRKYVIERECEE